MDIRGKQSSFGKDSQGIALITFVSSSPYPGILKKSSSSVDYLSRESTPDSGLGRIYDSVSGGGGSHR